MRLPDTLVQISRRLALAASTNKHTAGAVSAARIMRHQVPASF